MKKIFIFFFLYNITLGNIFIFKVGVGFYKDNRIPELQSVVNDCAYFQHIIDFMFKNSYTKKLDLYNENANLINFKEKIFYLLKESTENDTLIFYFSGHGYVKKIDSELFHLIALYDSDIDNPATFFAKEEFLLWFSKIKARLKIFIFDNCFSFNIDPTEIGKNTIIISASSYVTKSFIDNKLGISYFTFYFGKALKGRADFNNDNILSLEEIKKYLDQIFITKGINLTPIIKYSNNITFKKMNKKIAFVLSKNDNEIKLDIGKNDNLSIKTKLLDPLSNAIYKIDTIKDEYSIIKNNKTLDSDYLKVLHYEKLCNLIVEAKPWAIIELDGNIYGYTPYIIKGIPAGSHELKLSHPSLGQKTFDINITQEETKKIKVNMHEKKNIIN